jgi:hypothetical protein
MLTTLINVLRNAWSRKMPSASSGSSALACVITVRGFGFRGYCSRYPVPGRMATGNTYCKSPLNNNVSAYSRAHGVRPAATTSATVKMAQTNGAPSPKKCYSRPLLRHNLPSAQRPIHRQCIAHLR